ncbi:MAG TPA: FecR domain-containing protein, partial [Lysobacter sp.]|nr:FecR domain-containing protein [Lysobacter sp.]
MAAVWRSLVLAALVGVGSGDASAADWVYRVRPGDNLWDLASAHMRADVPWSRLQAYNRVADPRNLPPGQRLRFPVEWLRVQPERVRVIAVRGDVRIATGARAAAREGAVDMRIAANGWIETGENASATVEFADGSRLLLAGRSRLVFDRLSSFGRTGMVDSGMRLQRGRATNRVAPQRGPAARYDVSTPSATSSVRGTRFRVGVEDGRETTEVTEGRVGVGGTGSADLRAGFGSRNDGGVRARALLP